MVVKIISSLLLIAIASIILFSLIYAEIEYHSFTESLYNSTMIQTLVGIQDTPQHTSTKMFMSIQAFISYCLTAGVILVFSRHLHSYTY